MFDFGQIMQIGQQLENTAKAFLERLDAINEKLDRLIEIADKPCGCEDEDDALEFNSDGTENPKGRRLS